MDPRALRIALFSGNYNYTRDGANQALNRLVDHLLREGAAVRVYSPTVAKPAFPARGDLVSVPSVAFPGRGEYRVALGLPDRVRSDIVRFAPNIFHVSAPDILGHRAVSLARSLDLPVVASVHTRFETYFRYYGLGFVEPLVEMGLRRFYRRCDAIFAPSRSMVRLLRDQGMNGRVGIWTRGTDRHVFDPQRRDLGWRQALGIAPDMPVIGYAGRLVLEKGLDVFADTIDRLAARRVPHRVLVIGDGPARDWFAKRLKGAAFAGFLQGEALGRAMASMDMLFNPSVTETFGNVTLEAMASGLPVVAARAIGSDSLVEDGVTGRLIAPGAVEDFAAALASYCLDPVARAAAGRAGWEASRRYGWDEVNRALVQGYVRAIHGRTEPREAHGRRTVPAPW
ncbi:MAG TPA: glycosyltransferase family 1 protein [Allosphingosinicella sp.]|nr:glycosyltransferase family 1 protein [Allosphingosinicella sp.]